MNRKVLLRQIIKDMTRLDSLIVRVAKGERHLTQERDQLQAAVDLKISLIYPGPHRKAKDYVCG